MIIKLAATKFQLFKNKLAKLGLTKNYSNELSEIKRLKHISNSRLKTLEPKSIGERILFPILDSMGENFEKIVSPGTAGKSYEQVRNMAHTEIGRLKQKLGR